MNAISYNENNSLGSFVRPKEALESYSEYVSSLQRTSNIDKNLFTFLRKTSFEASMFITNSFVQLYFPLTKEMSYVIGNYQRNK